MCIKWILLCYIGELNSQGSIRCVGHFSYLLHGCWFYFISVLFVGLYQFNLVGSTNVTACLVIWTWWMMMGRACWRRATGLNKGVLVQVRYIAYIHTPWRLRTGWEDARHHGLVLASVTRFLVSVLRNTIRYRYILFYFLVLLWLKPLRKTGEKYIECNCKFYKKLLC